jgi:hypothetical protein
VIRRKSDANKTTKSCSYHEQMVHERRNQELHVKRQQAFPAHDPTAACWCCCTECGDLTWFYPPRKGGC